MIALAIWTIWYFRNQDPCALLLKSLSRSNSLKYQHFYCTISCNPIHAFDIAVRWHLNSRFTSAFKVHPPALILLFLHRKYVSNVCFIAFSWNSSVIAKHHVWLDTKLVRKTAFQLLTGSLSDDRNAFYGTVTFSPLKTIFCTHHMSCWFYVSLNAESGLNDISSPSPE